MQLHPEKVIQFNQIKEAHDIETLDWQLLQEKVVKLNHIKEALNIEVNITQKQGCFFSAATGKNIL